MADAQWKAAERLVAQLVGGIRSWNSEEDADVLVDGWVLEVKNRKAITVAQCEGWLRHNKTKAEGFDPPRRNGLVVKRKAGPGRPTPFLLIVPLDE